MTSIIIILIVLTLLYTHSDIIRYDRRSPWRSWTSRPPMMTIISISSILIDININNNIIIIDVVIIHIIIIASYYNVLCYIYI